MENNQDNNTDNDITLAINKIRKIQEQIQNKRTEEKNTNPAVHKEKEPKNIAETGLKAEPEAETNPILNSIEPDLEKQKQQQPAEAAKQESTEPTTTGTTDNTVETDEIFAVKPTENKPVIPHEVERYYIRVGDKYFHPKNTDLVAFEDKGNKLETQSNSGNIAKSMVAIAEARGWEEIKVTGTESFRREIWLEAAARGMHIKGYSPSETDQAALIKKIGESEANKIEKGQRPTLGRNNETTQEQDNQDKSLVLVAHGSAPYMHDKKNNKSYYVITRDNNDKEQTSWGVDLERAIEESGAKKGDKVQITNEGRTEVTVSVPVHDAEGNVIDHEDKQVFRNSWNVQTAKTLAQNSTIEAAIKQHPEFAGAAAIIVAADKKAKEHGLTPQERGIVNSRVRENVINSIEKGNIPTINIKEDIKQEAIKSQEMER